MDSTEDYREIVERAAQLGREYEQKYFGCSQSVAAAVMEAFQIGSADILRATTAFAGGMVRRGEVCGSLSGGIIVIGYLTGRDDLECHDQYQRGMRYADLLVEKFTEKYGTINCKEIQKQKFGRTFDLRKQEEREILHELMAKNPDGCQAVTGEGARLTAEVMATIFKDGPPLSKMLTGRR